MSKKTALFIMFFILGLVLVFHWLIVFEVIPYELVWAGKINSIEEMQRFEAVSILINLIILTTLFIKNKQLNKGKKSKVIDILIWIFVAIFALNSIGNLFAQNIYELIFGTLLTVISTILCIIIVRKKTSL